MNHCVQSIATQLACLYLIFKFVATIVQQCMDVNFWSYSLLGSKVVVKDDEEEILKSCPEILDRRTEYIRIVLDIDQHSSGNKNYMWSFFTGTSNDLIVLCIWNHPCAEGGTKSPSSIFSVLWDILRPGQGCLNTHTQSIAAGRHDKGDKILSGSHPGPLIKSSSTLCHTEMWLI